MRRFSPCALAGVALLLSMEYKGPKRAILRILQGCACLVIAANIPLWLPLELPGWYSIALNIAALAVNIPLAVMGITNRKQK